MKKYYNVELNRKDTMLLIDFLHENNIYFENSYIDSKYCHTEILLNTEEISIVNNFLDTL
jgi:hypothetical protein